jgi:glucosyl-3-phosphoglycerate phosphatase
MPAPITLALVRHGESTWNAEHRLQGQADPPLSELGREQSRALAPLIADLEAGPVICSDLLRARDTAELLGLEPDRLDPHWREVDLGEWSGKTVAEVDGGQIRSWQRGVLVPKGGENWPTFQTRVARALAEATESGESVLVVTHGGCIRAATAHLIGADRLKLAPPANASLTIFEIGARVRLQAYGLRPQGRETPGIS